MTIKFDVLNRFTGDVQFTSEIDCEESESIEIKLGLSVRWALNNGANLNGASLNRVNLNGANLNGANLNGANLNGASLNRVNLNGANLNGANLNGASLNRANLNRANLNGASLNRANLNGASLNRANLNGVNLWGVRGNKNQIKSIHVTEYDISFTESVVQIGCERHTKADWLAFSDDDINEMEPGALLWWKEWKPKLQAIGVFGEV